MLADNGHCVADWGTVFGQLGGKHPPQEHEDDDRQPDDDNVERRWGNHYGLPPSEMDIGTTRAQHASRTRVDVEHLVALKIGHNGPDEISATP